MYSARDSEGDIHTEDISYVGSINIPYYFVGECRNSLELIPCTWAYILQCGIPLSCTAAYPHTPSLRPISPPPPSCSVILFTFFYAFAVTLEGVIKQNVIASQCAMSGVGRSVGCTPQCKSTPQCRVYTTEQEGEYAAVWSIECTPQCKSTPQCRVYRTPQSKRGSVPQYRVYRTQQSKRGDTPQCRRYAQVQEVRPSAGGTPDCTTTVQLSVSRNKRS